MKKLWLIVIFFSGMIQSMTEKKHPLSRSGSYVLNEFYDVEDNDAKCVGKILATRPFVFTKTKSDGTTEGYKAYPRLASSSDQDGHTFKNAQGALFTLYGVKKLESGN